MTETVVSQQQQRPATADDDPGDPDHRWYTELLQFGVHAVVGTGVFVLIFAPAALLNYWSRSLHHWSGTGDQAKLSGWLFYVAEAAEIIIVAFDVLLLVIWLTHSLIVALKGMTK